MESSTDPKRPGFISEIKLELRETVGTSGVIGGMLPPVAFLALRPWLDVPGAAAGSLVVAMLVIWGRRARGKSIRFALAGAAGAALAALSAVRDGSTSGYFLPGMMSGAAATGALLLSVAMGRPAVALTSWVTRGWPLGWYLHPAVRPAYSLTTWVWVSFFGLRTAWQWALFRSGDATGLLAARTLGGWPATVALLIGTYALGRSRLRALAGPSVDEYLAGTPSPWVGQQRGF